MDREMLKLFLIAFDVRCLDIVECEIPAFLIAELGHALEEICIMWGLSGLHTDKADTQHLRLLLRPRRERPRCCCAAKQRDELPPPHSITSSAVESSVGGTVRPSILAVVRLMTSSKLVDCTTGRLAGFSPLRMRPA